MDTHAQEYASFESWCFFMYPEAAGPNNPARKTEKDPERKEGLIEDGGREGVGGLKGGVGRTISLRVYGAMRLN